MILKSNKPYMEVFVLKLAWNRRSILIVYYELDLYQLYTEKRGLISFFVRNIEEEGML